MKLSSESLRIILFSLLMATLFTCSDSGDKEEKTTCPEKDSASITINGQAFSFYVSSTTLEQKENGQLLELAFWITDPNTGPSIEILKSIKVVLFLNETGKNVIDEFIYAQNIDGKKIEGDFVSQTFTSNVISNNNFCFEANFSGTLEIDGTIIKITNGKISRLYEYPFNSP